MMSERAMWLLEQALELPAAERATVVDQLLISLTRPSAEVDSLWAIESEARINAYEAGRIASIATEDVFAELRRV